MRAAGSARNRFSRHFGERPGIRAPRHTGRTRNCRHAPLTFPALPQNQNREKEASSLLSFLMSTTAMRITRASLADYRQRPKTERLVKCVQIVGPWQDARKVVRSVQRAWRTERSHVPLLVASFCLNWTRGSFFCRTAAVGLSF